MQSALVRERVLWVELVALLAVAVWPRALLWGVGRLRAGAVALPGWVGDRWPGVYAWANPIWHTPLGVLVSGIVLLALSFIVRELRRTVLIIDPFSVPKEFEEVGLTPRAIASRIGTALEELEESIQSMPIGRDALGYSHHEAMLEFEVPQAKIGVRSMIEFLRVALDRYPVRIGGDVVVEKAAATGEGGVAAPRMVTLTLYVTRGRDQRPAGSVNDSSGDLDVLLRQTARHALPYVNPYLHGRELLAQQRYDDVLKTAEEMMGSSGKSAWSGRELRERKKEGLELRGWALIRREKYDEAKHSFEEALRIDPCHAPAYNGLGAVFSSKGRHLDSIRRYKLAARLEPKYANPVANVGHSWNELGMYAKAVECFERALRINPENLNARCGIGGALYLQSKKSAEKHFEEALKLTGSQLFKQADIYEIWGSYLERMADKEKDEDAKSNLYQVAKERYEKAIELNSNNPDCYCRLSRILLKHGQYEAAVGCCEIAISLDPKNPVCHFDCGNAWFDGKKYGEAVDCYKTAISYYAKTPLYHYNRGLAWDRQGEREEAADCFKEALDLDPKNPLYRFTYGATTLEDEASIEHIEMAILLDRKFMEKTQRLEITLIAIGQEDRAKLIAAMREKVEKELRDASVRLKWRALIRWWEGIMESLQKWWL